MPRVPVLQRSQAFKEDGLLMVILDGRSRTLRLHSTLLRRRTVIYSAAVTAGVHHLRLVAVCGLVALEGLAIVSRTG